MEMIDFLEQHKDKFYRFALRLTGNQYDAEDIVQELAIRIWKKGEEFEQYENQAAWCMSVVRNLSIDKLRSNKVRQHVSIEDAYSVSSKSISPETSTELQDTMNQVHQLINSMPEKYKTVIQLREIEEMTYKEIADIMNIEISKVKVNIFRARKLLQNLIENSGLKWQSN